MDTINIDLIKQRMALHGMSASELARRMSIDKAHVSRLLNGKLKNLNVHRLVQIMTILGIRPEEIFLF